MNRIENIKSNKKYNIFKNSIFKKVITLSFIVSMLILTFTKTSYAGFFTGAVSKDYYCQSSFFAKNRQSINKLNQQNSSYSKLHTGWDYVTRDGKIADAYILAVGDGKVVKAVSSSSSSGNGTNVIIEHTLVNPLTKSASADKTKIYSRYSHMIYNSLEVKAGEYVKAGTVIGRMGSTGSSTDPHLDIKIQDTMTVEGSAPTNLLQAALKNTIKDHWDYFSYIGGTTYYDFEKINFMLGPFVDVEDSKITPGKRIMQSPVVVPLDGVLFGNPKGEVGASYDNKEDANILIGGAVLDTKTIAGLEVTSDGKELSVDGKVSKYGNNMNELGGFYNLVTNYAGAIIAITLFVGIVSIGLGFIINRNNAKERANVISALFTIGIVSFMLGIIDLIMVCIQDYIG